MKTKKHYLFPNLSHRVLLSLVVTLVSATVGYFIVDYGMDIANVFISLMVSFFGVIMFMFLLGIGFSLTVPIAVTTVEDDEDEDDVALRRCMCFDPDDPNAPCLCNGPKTK